MKIKTILQFTLNTVISCSILISCNSGNEKNNQSDAPDNEAVEEETITKDSLVYSFAFVGCNRVDRHDINKTEATNGSTANLYALKRSLNYMTSQERKPDALFFLGDLVLGETTLGNLKSQLADWVKLYNNTDFSSISTSGIELVAVPGNHEMLSYANHNVPGHDEWPLKGAEAVWLKYMSPFMPKDRDMVTGPESMVNSSTFSFIRKNIGFIVMNTDTYNPPTKENPWGLEGLIPTDWILQKIKEYHDNPAIEHIFVLGHKPYYVSGMPETGHDGLPEGPTLWPALQQNNVIAMLSAHVHDYQRMQPDSTGTYQVIAGNGGSPGTAKFFGYTTINVYSSGKLQLVSKGYKVGNPYYTGSTPEAPFITQDSTILTWSKNANPYHNQ